MGDQEPSMEGKVCLVTGGTGGIGLVTAGEMARRGASVVLVGRSRARCEAAAEGIRARAGQATVDWIAADLSAQAEVRLLAEAFRRRYDRLDVLVNNAGALYLDRRESVDGIEMTLALNHLAPFLLTSLLLDLLRASAPSRVVVVSSEAHRVAPLDFEDLQARTRYRGFRTYGRSKLMNLLFTRELARRLENTGVTVNALHPGLVASGFFDGPGRGLWLARWMAAIFAATPEVGARTPIHLAGAAEVEGVTGGYFVKRKAVEPAPTARDDEAARRLWDLSAELTGLTSTAAPEG